MGIREKFFCNKHGLKHVQMKCDYCCAAAVYRCRGNTYYCEACHEDPKRLGKFCCGGNNKTKCPFGIAHEVGKRGIPLAGCIICTSAAHAQPILTEDKEQIRLMKVLEKTDKQLKTIVKHKEYRRQTSASARRMAVVRGEAEETAFDKLSRTKESSEFNTFVEVPGERNAF